MAYTWTNGEVITAEKLNNTCGILIVHANGDDTTQTETLDKTWQQICDAPVAFLVRDFELGIDKSVALLNAVGVDSNDKYFVSSNDFHNAYMAESPNGYPAYEYGGGK